MSWAILIFLLLFSGCAMAPAQGQAQRRQDVTLCFRKVNCTGLPDEKCLYELEGCSEVFK